MTELVAASPNSVQAIILAGGKGTRLQERLRGLPKPLVDVAGTPLLQRQLLHCKRFGITDILVLVNYKSERIEDFCFRKNSFGLTLTLMDDGAPRGTAGAVLAALAHLPPHIRDLLVLYGDTLLNVDLQRLYSMHLTRVSRADAAGSVAGTLMLHPNDHPHDSDLVDLDESTGRIRRIRPYPHPPGASFANLVNAALYVLRRDALETWRSWAAAQNRPLDFAKDLFPAMLETGQILFGYNSPEYIKDIGTPQRLDRAQADIASGRFALGSLEQARPTVFLDRDGVINREIGYISRPEQMELLPGVAEGVKRLNRSGLLSVVITNQPVVARGECTEEGLRRIHDRMETLLGAKGAYLDRVYYCPHHPDKGFPGERPELKIPCACRKPGLGLLEQAGRDLHIDMGNSWFVGDRTSDIQTARNAGIRSLLVHTGAAGQDGAWPVTPDYEMENLLQAVDFILERHPSLYKDIAMPLAKAVTPGSIVLIGGLARSGKSTLASLLAEALHARGLQAHKICLDSFLFPEEDRKDGVLGRYDMAAVAALAGQLRELPRRIALPLYLKHTRRLCPDASVYAVAPSDIIILEGVIALNSPELRAVAAQTLFVDSSAPVRKRRFLAHYAGRLDAGEKEALFRQREEDERPVVESAKQYASALVRLTEQDISRL